MTAILALFVITLGSGWLAKAAMRHDARPERLRRVSHVRSSDLTAIDVSQRGEGSMTWTELDDRQFRRLTDGPRPDQEA